MSHTNPAVVLGLNPNGLGVIRSLHAVGVPVIGVDQAPRGAADAHRWMSSRTRLCRKVFYDKPGADGLLECLLSLGASLPQQGVLIPSGDDQLLCISRNRDVLSRFYRFRVPGEELVELLANKAKFYPYAEERGAVIPRTFVENLRDNLDEIASSIRYPCLIKPSLPDREWKRLFHTSKVFTAANPDELRRTFDRVHDAYPDILIQEVVPGPDSNLYFSHVYMSEELEPIALWTGRKIRQHPIHFGTSTMTETVWVEEVAETSVSLLRELGCRGYASIEFKKDEIDSKYKIMEITPGRTWYPHFLGFGAGVNIPHAWYRDLLGQKQPVSHRATEGVRWVDEYRDLIASFAYWKHGELSFAGWLQSFRTVKIGAYASIKDPLPFFFVILRLLYAIPRAMTRRPRSRPKAHDQP